MAAQEIGSLFVNLAMNSANFDSQLKRIAADVKGFGTSINSGLTSVVGGMRALGQGLALIGVGLSVQAVTHWAAAMADLGDSLQNTAFALGITTQEVALLRAMFERAGGDAESAEAAFVKVGRAMQTALADPKSDAADNFRRLGISLKDVQANAGDTMGMLRLLADRVSKIVPGLDRTAVVAELAGRGFSRLAPVLRDGAAGFDALREKATPYAEAMQRNLGQLNEADEAFDDLKQNLKILAVDGFGFLTQGVSRMMETGQAFINMMVAMGQAAARMARQVVDAIEFAIEDAERKVKNLPPKFRAEIPPLEVVPPAPGPPGPKPAPPGGIQPLGAKTAKGGGGGDSRIAQWRDELEQMQIAERKFFSDSTADELKFWQGKLALVATGSKDWLTIRKTIFDLEKRLATQRRDDGIRDAEADSRVSDEVFRRKEQAIRHLVDIDRLSTSEGIAAQRELTEQKWQLDQEYYAKKRAAAEGDTRTLKTLEDQQRADHERHLTTLEGLDQSAEKTRWERLKRAIEDVGSVLENAFSSAFDKISDGTFRIRDALASLMKDFGKMLASRAFKMLIGGESGEGGGILGSLVGKVFGFGGGGDAGIDFGGGGDLLGAASGGSFRVGGSGPVDSKIVAFRATPGELVDVTPPGQRMGGGGEVVTIDLNPSEGWVAGVADRRIVTHSGQIINVAVRQSQKTVARNFAGMSGEASARQM